MDCYEEAINLAENVLSPTSLLNIQLTIKAAIVLNDLSHFPNDAFIVSKRGLLRAEMFAATTRELTVEETEALQVLRDQVAMLEFRIASSSEMATSSGRAIADEKLLLEENAATSGLELPPIKSLNKSSKGYSDQVLSLAQTVEKLKNTMRLDNNNTMTLADLDHATLMQTELKRLFSTYVRGNAVHAEMKSGDYVDIDGQVININSFLLDGPFMNWDGFSLMLHDFHICPVRNGKGNRKVNTRAGEDFLTSDPFVLMMIFVMAGVAPSCILAATDEDLHKNRAAGSKLWNNPIQIVTSSVPQPKSGLSFSQFVDCLARTGLVLLAKGQWGEMFSTKVEKVNGIFSTSMGLIDKTRVDRNLHFAQKSTLSSNLGGSGRRRSLTMAT